MTQKNRAGVANNDVATRRLGGVTGKGFMPGVSGNPGGRPATAMEFQAKCREFMEDQGWDLAVELATNPGRDQRPTLEFLAAYAYGKPLQPVQHSGSIETDSHLLDEFTLEELRDFRDMRRKVAASRAEAQGEEEGAFGASGYAQGDVLQDNV